MRTFRSLLPGSDNSPAACDARKAKWEAEEAEKAKIKNLHDCLWMEASARNTKFHRTALTNLAAARAALA